MRTIRHILGLFCLAAITMTAKAAGARGPAPGNPFEKSVQRLMTRAFSKQQPAHPSDYLISDDGSDLQQQYVNGAAALYGPDVQDALVNSLASFNTANASQGVKMFAFTGRYYLGYSDIRGISDQSANTTKIMNGLSTALQNQAANRGTGIYLKNFIKVLDDQYAAFQQSATALGKPKIIVLFYVEAVIGYDYIKNATLTPGRKKRYYCFIWTGGMNVIEEAALSGSMASFKQVLKLDPVQGLTNGQGLVSCVDNVDSLYANAANYDQPTPAIDLVWTMTPDQLNALTVAERIRLLKAMDKAPSLTDANNIIAVNSTGFSGEQCVVKIVSTVPDEEGAEWMDSLKTNPTLVVDLLSKLDNAGLGDNNYTNLVFDLLKFVYTQNPFSGDFSSFNSNTRSFVFNGFGLWNGIPYSMDEQTATGTIGGTTHNDDGLSYSQYSLGPFDYIGLLSSQQLPGLTYSTTLPNGHVMCAVPAFYLSWVLHVKNNQNAQQLVLLAIAIPANAMVMGAGLVAITTSESWIVQTIGWLDIISAAGSNILQALPVQSYFDNKYGTNSPQSKIISDINIALGLYNSARLVADLAGIPPKLNEAAALWKTERSSMVANGDVTTQQAGQIDKMLNPGTDEPVPPQETSTTEPPVPPRPPGWILIQDIRNKLIAIKDHILTIEWTPGSTSTEFGGCHSKIALNNFEAQYPGSTFVLNDPNPGMFNGVATGAYEAEPVITCVTQPGASPITLTKKGNNGTASFFPDSWDESRILDEVENAVTNNHGLAQGGSSNEYAGFSKDGTVEIHFYYNVSTGRINSYFPKIR